MHSLAFRNRLRKNFRHFSKWARRQGLTAYRVYDRDLPEFPLAVDWYDGRVHLLHYPRSRSLKDGTAEHQKEEAIHSVVDVLAIPEGRVFYKAHTPKVWGQEQYERAELGGKPFTIEEQGLKFWVRLGDYLDSGLFLDHRLTRALVRQEASGKRFLNLFAYTGSFTVYAAAGGAAQTWSVDLSRTYLEWTARNLNLNGLSSSRNQLIHADALDWILKARREKQRYDLIVLDPPSFSTSKRMAARFDVQRDHPRLLGDVTQMLAPGGTLYFSTPFQQFEPKFPKLPGLLSEEITTSTIPPDFRKKGFHRSWRLRSLPEPDSSRI